MISARKFSAILTGSLFLAAGINFFLVPFTVLDGGIIGISLIFNYLTGLKIGIGIMLCSVPVFIVAWFSSRAIFYNSIIGLIVSSFFIDFLEPYQYYFLYYIELSSFSSAILGGFMVGTGLGIMLRYETSTGGTDLLAQFISKYVPLNVGFIIFLMDGLIIGIGGLLLSGEIFLHSLLTIIAGGVATGLCTMGRISIHPYKP
ncbi:YitT family protein [Paenibacillus sp. FJAT-26967]|uniref:YitT family protein n=1 Tax=Paenibacillus sp. FJAT-26967 TaxID=1729690 RepID=UPI0008380E05|nr:YitT family protein [Paenibacillus sp. FJAT-26967]